jgi:hypothetical protein
MLSHVGEIAVYGVRRRIDRPFGRDVKGSHPLCVSRRRDAPSTC